MVIIVIGIAWLHIDVLGWEHQLDAFQQKLQGIINDLNAYS